MAKTLRFRFQPEKFVNAVAYLAQACPNSTKMTICKQLYYADKEHLVKYGRPITGDQYYRLPHGPIPTLGLNVLRKKAPEQETALLEKYVSVIGDSIHPRQSPNRKVFSQSDIEVLDLIVKKYGRMSAAALRRKSHSEAPWRESSDGCAIDYALFFKEHPGSEGVKELAEAEQESRDALRPYVTG
jgi:uncharacterized phage-associated protein